MTYQDQLRTAWAVLESICGLHSRETLGQLEAASCDARHHEGCHRKGDVKRTPRPRYAMTPTEVGRAWVMGRIAEYASGSASAPESWRQVAGMLRWRVHAYAVAELLMAGPGAREALRHWTAEHGVRAQAFNHTRDARLTNE